MLELLVLLLSTSPLVAARPYYSRTPARYDASKPAPLLLLVHPYYPGGGKRAAEMYQLDPILDDKGMLLAAPDGTLERPTDAMRFWNATDACCDIDKRGIDDVAYLTAVVEDMRARYKVDDKRIFVSGYSNGGYMTHRLLCEKSSLFAAGASVAGAGWKNADKCKPAGPASLLEVHGDQDEVVRYQGGTFRNGVAYPSSQEAIDTWAKKIGCAPPLVSDAPRDLIPGLAGAETTVARHGCSAGAAELWTVRGGAHRGLAPVFKAAIDFLIAHPKP
jgi:polyhydroxybutyrate depolymerase